jgi:hypothetical protein
MTLPSTLPYPIGISMERSDVVGHTPPLWTSRLDLLIIQDEQADPGSGRPGGKLAGMGNRVTWLGEHATPKRRPPANPAETLSEGELSDGFDHHPCLGLGRHAD